ncbi:MAG: hypothetical protein ACTSSK_11445 [Candidatus Heimdallarchaeota archaeon]
MKKQKLFVILIVSLFIGTSFAVFTTTNTMAKAVTRAYLISPQDGAFEWQEKPLVMFGIPQHILMVNIK